ncbi:DUF1127 domain-containing protein [Sulfitobacter sp. M57]|uniref:DUF1127 domain-containing protein n=1 Tax=unclassified Sulfitobacter TaxID=196795 RepID=UPI0023E0D09F|nr:MULTISPECIES: DUF1127 domain-containing protein [unclassified Sulfitobacter]MDF3413665.1 DUF1127 domain-containing protein [Sulfitobacter sp. KE5]MDF3421054.1 DUF1127 domain-containing protein [Sulfitobacter sp. KE43]MDF3432211.1 DUF1127 domain-containing protein [Sulfitobacter sp. KE42]MDF3457850.1 DUF1127 domain-containing protein [Sulfitobacter sp. S74]MDF3461751.1 DUF1127 domain-containing protein [Sulfitobacter sp. Ks18]
MTLTKPIPTDATGIFSQQATPVAAELAVRFAVLVTKWATRRRTRLALSQLEPWQLSDVGLTPAEARKEHHRVFWRV